MGLSFLLNRAATRPYEPTSCYAVFCYFWLGNWPIHAGPMHAMVRWTPEVKLPQLNVRRSSLEPGASQTDMKLHSERQCPTKFSWVYMSLGHLVPGATAHAVIAEYFNIAASDRKEWLFQWKISRDCIPAYT